MSITFLFGSGADTDACELPSGKEFSEVLIRGKYNKEVKSLLNVDTSHYKIIYPTSRKIFLQTIYENREIAENVIGKENVKKCIDYYNRVNDVKEGDIQTLCKQWYKKIKEDSNDGVTDFFLTNAVLFDSLDAKFNSLRYKKPSTNAQRVKIAYASIFIMMLKELYNLPENFKWSYNNVFDKLSEDYAVNYNAENYYSQLKEIKGDYYIATPNYTDIVQKITNKEVVFLHGKLTWFEDLKELNVYDCINEREYIDLSSDIIPFMMIPSGVKPIICSKQIKQFSKFIDILKKSNTLCVIGYRFNSEDNHINSLIAEWLKKENNKMIYFNYKDTGGCEINFSKLMWLKQFSNNVYASELKEEIFKYKISTIEIDKNNGRDLFHEFIKMWNRRDGRNGSI